MLKYRCVGSFSQILDLISQKKKKKSFSLDMLYWTWMLDVAEYFDCILEHLTLYQTYKASNVIPAETW